MAGGGFTPGRKTSGVESVKKADVSPDKVLTPHADLERYGVVGGINCGNRDAGFAVRFTCACDMYNRGKSSGGKLNFIGCYIKCLC